MPPRDFGEVCSTQVCVRCVDVLQHTPHIIHHTNPFPRSACTNSVWVLSHMVGCVGFSPLRPGPCLVQPPAAVGAAWAGNVASMAGLTRLWQVSDELLHISWFCNSARHAFHHSIILAGQGPVAYSRTQHVVYEGSVSLWVSWAVTGAGLHLLRGHDRTAGVGAWVWPCMGFWVRDLW